MTSGHSTSWPMYPDGILVYRAMYAMIIALLAYYSKMNSNCNKKGLGIRKGEGKKRRSSFSHKKVNALIF
jgi:hypothetical protein